MKQKWWLIISIIILLALTYPFVFSKKNTNISQVEINGKIIKVEIAKTDEARNKGLSNRKTLEANSGMLFIFDKPGIHPFWMKDTLIPLDIIWLTPSKTKGIYTIVDMTQLQPQRGDNVPSYTPKKEAQYALEVNANYARNNNISIGDEIKF
jgi:uncharacterized membrane protein (UPF0127 family)